MIKPGALRDTAFVDEPVVELSTGEVFAGWRVERELARGGMGVLYLAHHPRLPRTDVIKVLSPYLSDSPRFRDRFLAEANRMSTLSHPHVMPIHDSGTAENGTLYLVMPYIAGGDLRGLLKTVGRLEPRRASRLITQLAAALDAAHRIGVVHRDVKPENVMLSSVEPHDPDHALLTDFGISREELSATTVTATGELLLTPAYAAPEQALGQLVDARADQYALACILVELLTGQPPYEGEAPVVMLMAHLQEPVPQVAARFGLPPGIDAVLARALAKTPDARYPSCRDFALAVQEVLDPAASRTTDPLRQSLEPVSPTRNLPPSGPPPGPSSLPPSGPPSPPPPVRRPQPPAGPPTGPPPWQGAPPQQPAKSRRSLWLAIGGIVVLAGAGAGIALALSGGSSKDNSATNIPTNAATNPAGNTPTSTITNPVVTGTPAFVALVSRVPPAVAPTCTDTTAQLNAAQQPRVETQATCSLKLTGRTLVVSYQTVKGDDNAVTAYRMSVLKLGGANHHGGDCLTLQATTSEGVGNVGFAQDTDVDSIPSRIWCSKDPADGTLYDLENKAPDGSLRIITQMLTSDPGGVATAQQRLNDLAAVAPLR
ncbi:MAG: serine/threonine protein kinase [Mycobacterium sp.]|nr:serine/threonine protein kinase [Mycobacterium sp.]